MPKELTAELATQLVTDALVTHHPKLFSMGVAWSSRILDPASLTRSEPNEIGICSVTTEGSYGLAIANGGTQIGPAQELSNRSLDETADAPEGNALHFASRKEQDVVERLGFSPAVAAALVAGVDGQKSVEPRSVHSASKQVYFETADGEDFLVTPVISAKVLSEFTLRVPRSKGARYTLQPFGGSNPQNAGTPVAQRSRNSRRGLVLFLLSSAPHPPTDAARLYGRLAQHGRYDAVARLPHDELQEYVARSQIDIDLRSHLNAEDRHAAEIVELYLAQLPAVRSIAQTLGDPFGSKEPFDRFDRDEAAWIDPRNGDFDRARLSRRFADAVRIRARRVAKDSDPVLSDRSMAALRLAFERSL